MNILSWFLFAIINAAILFSLDPNPERGGRWEGIILGITGAFNASIFSYILVKGITLELSVTFYVILFMEACMLASMFFGKAFRKI